MEIVNTVKDGLHIDNNVYDQPQNTMRLNMNGIITNTGGNNYKWATIKGTVQTFTLGMLDKYMAHCLIRDRQFIFTYDSTNALVKLWEVTASGYTGTLVLKWTVPNADFNFDWNFPIRRIFGFYENDETQRIYWTDYNNQPRCVNIENLPNDNKFIDFFPVINHVYGYLSKADITSGGNVKAGTVFFAWRFYTDDGYYTDWSYLTNPTFVTTDIPASNLDSYQNMQGRGPDENTYKKITIGINQIDTDYSFIQVCAFYSNDYNVSIPGAIFYDGDITSANMEFTFRGNENLGSVTIDDLITSTILIDKLKDFDIAKKKNVISCLVEREELPLESYVEANMYVGTFHIPLDMSQYPGQVTSFATPKSLVYVTSPAYDALYNVLRRGCWYQALTDVVWYYNTPHGPGNVVNVAAGDIFTVPVSSTVVDLDSGTFKRVIAVRKYSKPLFGGYVYETEDLGNDFPDYKSQKVARKLKGYPQGETVRLGILFFDKTGRPFYVRHLRNTNNTYGPGDVNIPKRSMTNKLLSLADSTNPGGNAEYWRYAFANTKYITVGSLDLTDIIDQIGAFMIVRAPIIRQYESMGILVPTYRYVNDIFSYPALFSYTAVSDTYYGCYDFYSPEDMFNFKGFSIQTGDELENIQYCHPYYRSEDTNIGGFHFIGLGRRESNANDFYNKFFIEFDSAPQTNHNGHLGTSHEILAVTRFELGQDEISINPLDNTKLYSKHCIGYLGAGPSVREGLNVTHSVLMLNTGDEGNGAIGKKGIYDATNIQANALICALKRANTDPYGGYDDSSLANTVYMSTGHYQEITTDVLNDIAVNVPGQGIRYIFNGIQVFGGDTYVQLFDFKRILPNYDDTDQFGHSVIFPVETRINLSMREGNHIAKTRSYDNAYVTSGLKVEVGATVLEEFNYNDGYSSDNINDLYVPLPFNNKLISDRDTRIRYSAEKNYGENRDSFRVFLANNYIDLDTTKGAISNIKYKSNRLIYWQPDEVGYIPISERALTETSMGAPVQLGVGGIFERYDQLVDKIGNSHQFGLIESPMGYHWYDSRRKIFISINHGMQLAEDSILKGLDSFFQDNIPDALDTWDNPFATVPGGVHGGYDPMTKMIFATFNYPIAGVNYTNTIGIHSLLNKFIGYYNFFPVAYYTYKDHMHMAHANKLSVWTHGVGAYCTFFGTRFDALVSIVIKENSNEAKVFDTFEVIGNDNFFTSIAYENSEQSIEEQVVTYVAGEPDVLIRNLKYLKKRWFGNFPRASRERLNDGYVKVTFKINAAVLVELLEMKTDVRKMM